MHESGPIAQLIVTDRYHRSQRWPDGPAACKPLLALLGGCASTQHQHPQSRPFFLTEEGIETHGRKTWFDRLIETDPGGVSVEIAADYQDRPPRKIAVLPFVDEGYGSYFFDKVPI